MTSSATPRAARFQFSLRAMLVAIAVCSVATAALRSGDWLWARILFTLTLGLHLAAVLGVVYRTGGRRAFWIGFALFGWSYFAAGYLPWLRIAEYQLPHHALRPLLHYPEGNERTTVSTGDDRVIIASFSEIVQSLFMTAFALAGGLLGVCFHATRAGTKRESEP